MNTEQLKTLAADAIGIFAREHNGTCYLKYINGKVIALPLKDANPLPPTYLCITHFGQVNGLTDPQWSNLANELFAQYLKELACQNRPKP